MLLTGLKLDLKREVKSSKPQNIYERQRSWQRCTSTSLLRTHGQNHFLQGHHLQLKLLRLHQNLQVYWRESNSYHMKGKKRCELELCFNCEEKYHFHHVCKQLVPFMLLQDTTNGRETVKTEPEIEKDLEDEEMKPNLVVLHTLIEESSPKWLILQGHIYGQQLQILVDSGSTLNFIYIKWFSKLWSMSLTTSMSSWRMVSRWGSNVCAVMEVHVGSNIFKVNLHIIPFGADIVLGVD